MSNMSFVSLDPLVLLIFLNALGGLTPISNSPAKMSQHAAGNFAAFSGIIFNLPPALCLFYSTRPSSICML